MIRNLFKGALFIPSILVIGITSVQSDSEQTDLCQVNEFIESGYADKGFLKPLSGPIEGCRKGDSIHFQIDGTKVPAAPIVARFCDLDKTVLVENHNQYIHVVCAYHWKWAKQVTRAVHPDSRVLP